MCPDCQLNLHPPRQSHLFQPPSTARNAIWRANMNSAGSICPRCLETLMGSCYVSKAWGTTRAEERRGSEWTIRLIWHTSPNAARHWPVECRFHKLLLVLAFFFFLTIFNGLQLCDDELQVVPHPQSPVSLVCPCVDGSNCPTQLQRMWLQLIFHCISVMEPGVVQITVITTLHFRWFN